MIDVSGCWSTGGVVNDQQGRPKVCALALQGLFFAPSLLAHGLFVRCCTPFQLCCRTRNGLRQLPTSIWRLARIYFLRLSPHPLFIPSSIHPSASSHSILLCSATIFHPSRTRALMNHLCCFLGASLTDEALTTTDAAGSRSPCRVVNDQIRGTSPVFISDQSALTFGDTFSPIIPHFHRASVSGICPFFYSSPTLLPTSFPTQPTTSRESQGILLSPIHPHSCPIAPFSTACSLLLRS